MKIRNVTEEELQGIGIKIMTILDSWPLTDRDKMNLLGFSDEIKERQLTRYRNGTAPFPDDEDQLERVRHLMGIQKALEENYPLNSRMPAFWVNHFQKPLKGIPMQIMIEDGLAGMYRVWRHLDCTANW